MTREEAKNVLLRYRPDQPGERDPETQAALELARQDPELGRWLEEHSRFQRAVQTKLRSVAAPAALKERLLVERKLVRPALWSNRRAWLLAAAACGVLLAVVGFWPRSSSPDGFANFQSRMVSTALRQYRMDVVTPEMPRVRDFLASRGAPADYEVTPGLEKLKLTGGGVLTWRSQPVSMVCFDRGDNQMLYLFVADQKAIRNPPGEKPEVERVRDLIAVSWRSGGKVYVLAGPEEGDFARKYL